MWINCQLFQKKFGLLARYRRPKLNKCVLQLSSNQLDMPLEGIALERRWRSFGCSSVLMSRCEKGSVCISQERTQFLPENWCSGWKIIALENILHNSQIRSLREFHLRHLYQSCQLSRIDPETHAFDLLHKLSRHTSGFSRWSTYQS